VRARLAVVALEPVEDGEQRLDHDRPARLGVDELARHDRLARERAQVTGDQHCGVVVVAAVDGDDERHAQVAQQGAHRVAGFAVGVLGVGVDDVHDTVDLGLQHVGHEPEATLAGRAEQQQTYVAAADRVRAEVHGDGGAGLHGRLVAGRRHVGVDDRGGG
jgi:hypothetical protein